MSATRSVQLVLVAMFASFCLTLSAGEALTNAQLLKMLREGLAWDVVKQKIAGSNCRFDDSSEALIEVQKAGKDGNWSVEDIKKLQAEIMRVSGLDQRRLREMAEKAINVFDNAKSGEEEYEMMMRELVLEGRPVVTYLLKHIHDESERKRGGVADSLGRIGDKSDEALLAALLLLSDPRSKPVRHQAAKSLSILANENTGKMLIERLKNPNDKHDGIAMALGYLGEPQSVEALAKLLRASADSDARVCAAWALGHMRARVNLAADALLEAVLDERDENLRQAAAAALSLLGERRAPAYIMKAFQRFQRKGGAELIRNLDRFKDVEVVEFLIEQFGSDIPAVKKAARETLNVLTGESFETDEEARGWLEANRERPDWKRGGAPKLPEPRGSASGTRESPDAVPTSNSR